ncbi:hypothetical protein H072_1766 [Dactylellina haptotyla CBS 200.50]|uniref:Uncharacterized protein n=1 Tax=Dactylellina haptotyla (strain CBS 200.50) TaxID=1284197 RepID=S8AN00_DACHA|nr:hypothetical protein H072_1766 [Dactylellina haptotyla CBS 200.50]
MGPPHAPFSTGRMIGKIREKTDKLAIVDVFKTGKDKTIRNVRGIHGEAERRLQHLGRETEEKFSGAIHGLGGAVVNLGRGIQERGRRNVDKPQEPPSDAVEIADVSYQVENDVEDLAAESAYTNQGSFFDGVEPENCWDQEAMSYDIRQAGLAGGLNFGNVTNGGLTFEEAFAYEQSESSSSIDPGDLERTYSTDGSLGLGDDIDNQGNPTPALMGYLSPVNEPPPQLQEEKPQFSTNMENPYLNRRFLNAAWAALKKLRNAANQECASPQLREFVGLLGDLDSVIRLGLESLRLILDGKTPSRLSEVYCFLHVAYAISRAKKTGPDEDLPSEAFRKDLQIFRRCLSSVSDVETGLSDQDIFDEIVEVMWKELQEGLEYINSMLKKKYSSDSKGLSPQPSLRSLERRSKTGPLQQKQLHHVSKTYRRSPSSSPLFKKRSNPSFPGNHSTSVLHYLKVTVEDVKNTTIFKELICVFYEIGSFRFL